MVRVDIFASVFSFHQIRYVLLMCHFILTTFLVWTRYPSIQITLPPNYSHLRYNVREDSYISLIALGIVFLLLQFFMLPATYGRLAFRQVMAMAADVAGIFFISWIILDGLSWQTYIYIFVFCVLLPSIIEALFVIPMVYAVILYHTKILIAAIKGYFMQARRRVDRFGGWSCECSSCSTWSYSRPTCTSPSCSVPTCPTCSAPTCNLPTCNVPTCNLPTCNCPRWECEWPTWPYWLRWPSWDY